MRDKLDLRLRGVLSADLLSILDEYESDVERGKTSAASPLARTRRMESEPLCPILLLSHDSEAAVETAQSAGEDLRPLADGLLAGEISVKTVQSLEAAKIVDRAELMKPHKPLLDCALPTIGLPVLSHDPQLEGVDGRGVLVGIIDSGFDLAHPCFHDANGRLRVDGLLDQTTGLRSADWKKWSAEELERSWAEPASGDDVHGTHVASIAAGSPFGGFRGIATGARYLLVKTDFRHTTDAMAWIFGEAKRLGRPCVVNCSFGHHDGAHDGTHIEEREGPQRLSDAGFIFVAAAGNSGCETVHVRAVLEPNTTREIPFRAIPNRRARLKISGWYAAEDDFQIRVIPPGFTEEQALSCPAVNGSMQPHTAAGATLRLKRATSAANRCVEVSVQLGFMVAGKNEVILDNWKLSVSAGGTSAVGVIDFWIAADGGGGGEFYDSALIESSGTITMPATSPYCISVGSAGNKSSWPHDGGIQQGSGWRAGVSPFSSRGPSRSRLEKPDLVAPGEWVTAACARGWQTQIDADRVLSSAGAATLRGTSMAAPLAVGVMALMLNIKKNLTLEQAGRILRASATKRHCACTEKWCAACGCGFLEAVGALRQTLASC